MIIDKEMIKYTYLDWAFYKKREEIKLVLIKKLNNSTKYIERVSQNFHKTQFSRILYLMKHYNKLCYIILIAI